MVLEKLGSSLKETLKKIASSVFVDEKLINELIKDIQRALLQADVNVQLVFDLTKKIKERALKEEAHGLSKKEHLIKIVYDELVEFLGGKGEKIEIKKKPFKMMLVGLFGSGKCVHKNTNILLSDGLTVNIEKLYKSYKAKEEIRIREGYILPLKERLFVPSFNPKTLEIEKKRATHLWKLRCKELIKLDFDNGNNFSIKTTPEHPFFSIKNGILSKSRADRIKEGDFIAVSNNVCTDHEDFNFLKELQKLNINIKINDDVKEIKNGILKKYKTLKNALKSFPYKRDYAKFTLLLKKGELPLYFYNTNKEQIRLRNYKSQAWINFPLEFDKEFAEFIGYIIGDGYLSRQGISISNADKEIINRIKYLSKKLFSINPSLTIDKRSKAMHIRLSSVTLTKIIHKLFNIPIGKKTDQLEIPKVIQKSSLSHVKYFIRAYFDCDAYFSSKTRSIDLISESQILIKQIHHLLLKFGIIGTQSKKLVNDKFYYRLVLQARSAEKYSEKINSIILRKQEALSKYSLMAVKQGDGKKDMIPVGNLLEELRTIKRYTINQIQKNVSSYGLYESKGRISKSQLKKVINFYEKKEKGNISSFLDLIKDKETAILEKSTGLSQGLINSLVGEFKNKNLICEVSNSPKKIVLTKKGKNYLNAVKDKTAEGIFENLKHLAYADVSWVKVNDINRIKNDSKYVYDLTVEDNHSFIADGIVVHNTTTSGKLARFYKKRGKKVALIGLDIHRPAAMDQIEQIAKQADVPVFLNKKEKDPLKIWNENKDEYSQYDILIIDTAGRDALSEDLIEEIETLNKEIKPDENLLVISADIGQAAQKQAEQFHKSCGITGVIATKMDGTAKAGGALSACSVTNAPIKFIGVGEKLNDFETFNPEGFVSRLLGMGDLEALLEKAEEVMPEDAEDLGKRFLKGDFNLIDLYEQMKAMKKMGSLSKLMEMIPGFSQLQLPKEMLDVQESKLEKWKHAMSSMSKEELEDPELIDSSRIDRISKGSAVPASEIKGLVKQYRQGKKMMKSMAGKGVEKMMKKFQSGKFKLK